MDKIYLKKIKDYIADDKGKFYKKSFVLHVGTGHKETPEGIYDLMVQVFVKKGSPLENLPKTVRIDKEEIPVYYIEDATVKYEESLPNYDMPPELE